MQTRRPLLELRVGCVLCSHGTGKGHGDKNLCDKTRCQFGISNQKIDFGIVAKSVDSGSILILKSYWLRAGDDRGRKWICPSGWEVSQ